MTCLVQNQIYAREVIMDDADRC